MQLKMGKQSFVAESKYLTLNMEDSNGLLNDTEALRQKIDQDGFLLLRGLHDPEEVINARRDILTVMSNCGKLDLDAPLLDGVVHPNPNEVDTSSVRNREHLKQESLFRVVYGTRIMSFFDRLLGGEAMSYNFQWLRTAGPGSGSTIHYDVVYMGRGTKNLYTCWTPLGTITPDMGPLAICLGSNRWQRVIETYGRTDVDRDQTCGYFSDDPAELVDKFGGRWASTTFEPGDVVILNMFIMHASLTNMSNKYRISCDTRYQLVSEPVDERWSGKQPKTHAEFWAEGTELEPVDVSRKKWRI